MSRTPIVHAQQRWEFCLLERRTETTLIKDANTEGDQGWELVSVMKHEKPKGTFWTAFMKRPHTGHATKPETEEKATAQPPHQQPSRTPQSAAAKPEGDGEPEVFEFKD